MDETPRNDEQRDQAEPQAEAQTQPSSGSPAAASTVAPAGYGPAWYPQSGYSAPAYHAPGYGPGYAPGYASGYAPGYSPGYSSGYSSGYAPGQAPGYTPGQAPGYIPGYGTGYSAGYTPGYHEQLGQAWGSPHPTAQLPWTAPPVAKSPRRHRAVLAVGVIALLAAIGAAGVVSADAANRIVGSGTSFTPDATGNGNSAGGSGSGSSGTGNSGNGSNGFGNGSGGSGSTGTGSGTATTAQQVGVVDVDTVLQYQNEEAAGTGLVLTSDGEILTNNHVIDGATSITVTVVSTGKTYKATVVGDDPTADVAVLKLSDASGLKTANISTSAKVAVGDAVTAVGNAGGTGGTPSTASGTVVALNQSITASDDSGQNPENLTGLIESNAPIQAGDSGGPLYNAKGQIIGIDTAGSTSSGRFGNSGTATQAFSIPISTAVSIAAKIEAGDASSTIHLGYPAFLGVQIAESNEGNGFGANQDVGALISGVVSGSPAEDAGLTAGDTITGVGSAAVTSANGLQTALATHHAGQTVKISWTDASGRAHSASVKLIAGPAD